MFLTRFSLLLWRSDLNNRGVPKECSVSSNLLDCVMIDSDVLLVYTMWLLEYPDLRATLPYAPWRLGS